MGRGLEQCAGCILNLDPETWTHFYLCSACAGVARALCEGSAHGREVGKDLMAQPGAGRVRQQRRVRRGQTTRFCQHKAVIQQRGNSQF